MNQVDEGIKEADMIERQSMFLRETSAAHGEASSQYERQADWRTGPTNWTKWWLAFLIPLSCHRIDICIFRLGHLVITKAKDLAMPALKHPPPPSATHPPSPPSTHTSTAVTGRLLSLGLRRWQIRLKELVNKTQNTSSIWSTFYDCCTSSGWTGNTCKSITWHDSHRKSPSERGENKVEEGGSWNERLMQGVPKINIPFRDLPDCEFVEKIDFSNLGDSREGSRDFVK